jgi:predicted outer membrane repeat protein
MSLRTRVGALATALALLAGSAAVMTVAPAGATTVSVTVTSSADSSGTCPSTTDCTLRQAITDARSGGINATSDAVITIAEGLGTIALGGTLTYDGGSTTSLNLTLNGNGVAITGNDTFRLLTSNTTGSVVIDQVAFSRGRDVLGGAINSRSDLTLTNSSFTANNADGGAGAVFASGSLEIDQVAFEDNNAPSGGAIFGVGALFVQNSLFADNSATDYGGAINSGSPASAEITTTRFIGNTSGNAGGAVYQVGPLVLGDVVFEDNSATNFGGAFWGMTDVDVSNAVFLNNSSGVSGGAAFISGNSTIDNAMFISNESVPGGYGGAIKINGTLDLSDSTFEANSAANGGAISATGNVVVAESFFDSNTSGGDGGAMTVSGDLDLTNSTVSNNSSTTGQGALRVTQDAVISNSTITANAGGGQISTVSAATLTVTYTTLTELQTLANQDAIGASGNNISLFATVLTGADGAAAGSLCGSAATSLGYNYATDSSCGLTETGDVEGAPLSTAVVGALADHDGTMFTQLPLANGPLVGAIPNASCFLTSAALSTDQRGFARPNVDGGSCDIGAVQLTPQMSTSVAGRTVTMAISEFTATATITMYSDPIVLGTIANDAAGSGTGTFDVDCSVQAGTHTVSATAAGGQTASTTIELEACAVPAFTG